MCACVCVCVCTLPGSVHMCIWATADASLGWHSVVVMEEEDSVVSPHTLPIACTTEGCVAVGLGLLNCPSSSRVVT